MSREYGVDCQFEYCFDPSKLCCPCGGGDTSIAAVPGDGTETLFVVMLCIFCFVRAWVAGYFAEEPPMKYYWPYDGVPAMSCGTRECLGSVLWFFIPIVFTLPADIPDPGLPVLYSRKLGANTLWVCRKDFTIAPNPFVVLFCWPNIPCYNAINLILRPRFNEYAPYLSRDPPTDPRF